MRKDNEATMKNMRFEIYKLRKGSEKDKAYAVFFEYCRERLLSLGAETIGDLPGKEQTIIAKKHKALIEKYGPAHNSTLQRRV